MAIYEGVGVRAIVEGTSKYVSDANAVNAATEGIGKAAANAATSTKKFDESLQAIGSRLQNVGHQAIYLGSALAAPSVGASILAANFDQAITRLSTLSGIATKDLGALRDGVLAISRTTAQGPQELADALLLITSTGLRGAQALSVLKLAAEGAAVGMGDVQTVGQTVTAIFRAYESTGITAARTMDILYQSAVEGGAEVDTLAGSLGRVIGIAATFGVKFEEVGAFMATFTRLGVSSEEAATALRGSILAIFGPANESTKALESLGTSSEELKQIVKDKGLLAALQEMIRLSDGNSEVISTLIPNVRALAGVLGTAGTQGAEYQRVLDNITQSQGNFAKAFGEQAATPRFRFDQAVADLKRNLVELGATVLPLFAAIASGVSTVANAFELLPEPVKAVTLAVGLFGGAGLVAVGALALLAGTIVSLSASLVALGPAISTIGALLLASPVGWGLLGAAVIATGFAYAFMKSKMDEMKQAQVEQAAATRLATSATSAEIEVQVRKLAAERDVVATELEAQKLLVARGGARDAEILKVKELTDKVRNLDTAIHSYIFAGDLATTSEKATGDAAEKMKQQIEAATAAAQDAGNPLITLSEKAKQLQDSMKGVSSAALATKIILESIANIQGATFENVLQLIDPGALQRQIEAGGKALKPILDVQEAIDRITGRVTNSAGRTTSAQEAAATKVAAAGSKMVDDAAAAAQKIADARLASITQLGDLVTTALRRQAQQQLNLVRETVDAQTAVVKKGADDRIQAIKDASAAAVKSAEDARDAQIDAIKATTQAQVDAVQRQIDALTQQADTEKRAQLVRAVALAYDAKARAAAQQALTDFDRQQQAAVLRDQISNIQRQGNDQVQGVKDAADARIVILKDTADEQVRIEEQLRDNALANLAAETNAAQKAYDAATTDFAIQSKARELVMKGEVDKIGALLDEQVPEWRSAGLSFGQQMIQGLVQSGVADYITNLLGQLNRVNSAAGGAAGAAAGASQGAATAREIAGRQVQGMAAAAGGAPQGVIDSLRQGLIDLGAVPQFAGGLDVGVVKRPILAALDPGEVVLTAQQQRDYMGGSRFERGAFEGMFSGANFTGSPREIAAEIKIAIEDMIGYQTGRGAFLNGV